jgi:hypothetical protein
VSLETPNYSLQIVCSQFHVLWAHYLEQHLYTAERRRPAPGARRGRARRPDAPKDARACLFDLTRGEGRGSPSRNPDLSSDHRRRDTRTWQSNDYGLRQSGRVVCLCLCVFVCCTSLSSRCLAPRLPSIPHTPSTANSNRIMRDTARTYASGERARNTRGPHASTEGPRHTVCRRQADRDRGGGRAL